MLVMQILQSSSDPNKRIVELLDDLSANPPGRFWRIVPMPEHGIEEGDRMYAHGRRQTFHSREGDGGFTDFDIGPSCPANPPWVRDEQEDKP